MKGIFSSAPLFLFLLLLLVLAVSSYLGESAQLTTEGFIQFSGNSPLMGVVDVADYSVGTAKNTAIKLYDNMYFDPKNANLVEIGGGIMTTGNAESTGI
ncbi:hypothetical protein EB093_09690, partial [bacterium]|nr:hypothetical protein [bacterium]